MPGMLRVTWLIWRYHWFAMLTCDCVFACFSLCVDHIQSIQIKQKSKSPPHYNLIYRHQVYEVFPVSSETFICYLSFSMLYSYTFTDLFLLEHLIIETQ
jgi:hypothetical protein